MYYLALSSFEAFLRGHATAFSQVGILKDDDEDFSSAFAMWLYMQKGAGGASAGWAILIDGFAAASGANPDHLFRDLAEEFLQIWAPEDTADATTP